MRLVLYLSLVLAEDGAVWSFLWFVQLCFCHTVVVWVWVRILWNHGQAISQDALSWNSQELLFCFLAPTAASCLLDSYPWYEFLSFACVPSVWKSSLESYCKEAVSERPPPPTPTNSKNGLEKACPFPNVTPMCCQVENNRDRTFIQLCRPVTRTDTPSSSLHKLARACPGDKCQVASGTTHPLQVQLPEFAQSLFAFLGGQLLRSCGRLGLLYSTHRNLYGGGEAEVRAGSASPRSAQVSPRGPGQALTADPGPTLSAPSWPGTQALPPLFVPAALRTSPTKKPG